MTRTCKTCINCVAPTYLVGAYRCTKDGGLEPPETMERKLAADYLRWLASTLPYAVHTLVSGGEEVNAAISISRFARDTTGLSKAVAWTHAKRVVQAFREGLYTI